MFDYQQNPMYNPMVNPYLAPQQPQPRREVVKVSGENGARAYPMGANSSALLLDENGVIVWLVTTDGAGYKSVAPFDITPHQAEPAPDFSSLEARISRLEERINAATGNSSDAQRSAAARPRTDTTDRVAAPQPQQSAREIAAERNAKLAEACEQYGESVKQDVRYYENQISNILTSRKYGADSERGARALYPHITDDMVELAAKMDAIEAEYADELWAAEKAEHEAEPVPAWLADMIEF